MNRKERRAAEASASRARDQFFAAIEHHRAGRLAEAERLYRGIISGGVPVPEVHNNLGILLHQRGNKAAAAEEYRKAITLDPSDPGAFTNLASTLRDLNQTEEAEACYRRALSIKPDHAEANNNLGMLLSDRGRHAEALACYQKTLAANPGFADALVNSGVALRRTGDNDQAIELWLRAIAVKPNSVEAHAHLADMLADLGRIEEARQHAIVADRLDVPARPAVRFALGIALARCGIRESAIARLRQCADADPQDRYGARLALAALNEAPMPAGASDELVDRLYAIDANRWDSSGGPYPYRGAQLVSDKVLGERLDVLDAGCGTGPVGALVRGRSRRLVGVDLSAVMLERAKSKNVYDELHQGDLIAFMQSRPQAFDVVTCAATLIHFGDLAPAFGATATTLRAGGAFIFTVFPNERDAGFSVAPLDGLAQGGCFVHGRGYIVATATAGGFNVETIESAVHEYKNGQPVPSLLAVLRKV
jgi:predicted TPR repeat methyltransferase